MKGKHWKALAAIYSKPTPANLVFADIEAMLVALGAQSDEGAGSRIAHNLHGTRLYLHRPHPRKEAAKYQVEEVRAFLAKLEIEP